MKLEISVTAMPSNVAFSWTIFEFLTHFLREMRCFKHPNVLFCSTYLQNQTWLPHLLFWHHERLLTEDCATDLRHSNRLKLQWVFFKLFFFPHRDWLVISSTCVLMITLRGSDTSDSGNYKQYCHQAQPISTWGYKSSSVTWLWLLKDVFKDQKDK